MTDLLSRLRDTPNWMRESYGSWKDCVLKYDRAPFEAADEIEHQQNSIDNMRDEIERLRAALNWYADEARACAKNSHTSNHAAGAALLASVTVLALDGGKRADAALRALTPSTSTDAPAAPASPLPAA
jgi:hypothetical protein